MLLKDLIEEYVNEGYKINYARVRVCQDILFLKISKSKYKDRIAVKGGTIMYQLTCDKRRATMDLDIDLINTSISTESIISVFKDIGEKADQYSIGLEVEEGSIKELSHEDYKGKRIVLRFTDESGDSLSLKLDIGVHKNVEIKQKVMLFDMVSGNGVIRMLINL